MLTSQIVQQSKNSMEIDGISEIGNANGPNVQSRMNNDDDSANSDSSSSDSSDDLLSTCKLCNFDDMSIERFSARSTTSPLLRAFTQVRMMTDAPATKIDDVPNKKGALADVGCAEKPLLIEMVHDHGSKLVIATKPNTPHFESNVIAPTAAPNASNTVASTNFFSNARARQQTLRIRI